MFLVVCVCLAVNVEIKMEYDVLILKNFFVLSDGMYKIGMYCFTLSI